MAEEISEQDEDLDLTRGFNIRPPRLWQPGIAGNVNVVQPPPGFAGGGGASYLVTSNTTPATYTSASSISSNLT